MRRTPGTLEHRVPQFKPFQMRLLLLLATLSAILSCKLRNYIRSSKRYCSSLRSPHEEVLANVGQFASALTTTSLVLLSTRRKASADESEFVRSLSNLIEAQLVVKPTIVAMESQAYDVARFNLLYVQNQLQLQKMVTLLMRNAFEYCDDDCGRSRRSWQQTRKHAHSV